MEIKIQDTATPTVYEILKNNPDWTRKALKSTGYMVQQTIKRGIKSSRPGGKPYARTMPEDKRRKLERILGHSVKPQYPILGDLQKAVGYEYKDGRVIIGWLSRSAERYGKMHEQGYERQVTDRMRNAFLAAGFKVGKKIKVKSRKTYDPMLNVVRPKIGPHIQKKIAAYVAGVVKKSLPSDPTRKYIVKGEFV